MKKIIIIDGNSLAYSRIPDEKKISKEEMFSKIDNREIYIVRKFIKKILHYKYTMFNNYELIVIFDEQNKHTFRHELSKKYKNKKLSEKRQKQKNFVYQQINEIKKLLKKIGIPFYSTKKWEADDIIGMLVEYLENKKYLITIVSGDKDILQLISKKTRVLYTDNNHHMINTNRNNVWDISGGVWPDQIIEMKMISGDSSDNIKGIGLLRNGKVDYWTNEEAKNHIKKWNTIDNMFKNINKISAPYRESLIRGKEKLDLNRKLVSIIREWKLEDIHPEFFVNSVFDKDEVKNIINDLSLESIFKNKKFKSNFGKEKIS
ncbi:MAG: hypothetical protein HRS50_01190 [Mycoplasmataceae bacterium]|nr:hypothetical protein [Mycoplasmataceae bacterium]